MPTKKNSNDNDKGRRRSGGGSRSRQHRGQSKTNVGKVVDQLDDMIFGCNPMRLCDDKDPRALKGCLSDERYTNGEAAELVRDRLKEAFVQDIDHADRLPSDTLSDLLSEDETNEILIDDTLTLDTCSSIGSIEKVEKVPAPLPPEPSQLAPDGPTRSFFESETPRIGSRRSSAKTFATENEPVVRETAAPEEERSVLNNRQITGEGNTAKVEVDDSCKKNEVTETGLEIQAPPAPPCDNRDDDKDELGLIVANTSAPVEDEPTVTKSTVAAAVLVAPKNSRDEVVAPDGISESKEIVSPTIEPVVRETAAPEEERSVLNNRQITGEGNTAKVEVDDSCKKNEATETGLNIQAPPAPPCDGKDDDKDELDLIVKNATDSIEDNATPEEDEPTVTTSTVAAAILVAPEVKKRTNGGIAKRAAALAATPEAKKAENSSPGTQSKAKTGAVVAGGAAVGAYLFHKHREEQNDASPSSPTADASNNTANSGSTKPSSGCTKSKSVPPRPEVITSPANESVLRETAAPEEGKPSCYEEEAVSSVLPGTTQLLLKLSPSNIRSAISFDNEVNEDVELGYEESISDSKKEKGKKKRRFACGWKCACLLVTACMIIILGVFFGLLRSAQKRNSEQKAADFSGGEPRTLPMPPTSLSSSVPTFKPSTAPVVGASVSVQPTPLPTTDKPVSASPTASTEDEVVDEKTENIENRPADEESAGAITFDANQPSGEDDVPTLTDESGFVQDAIGNAPVATPSGVPMMDNTVPTQGPSISPVSRSPTKSPSASPVSGSPTAAPVSDPLTASPVSDRPTAAPESTSAPVSDPPTASPVSDPPTAAAVTPEPSSAPVSDPPTMSLVSDPPTTAPGTSKPSSPGPTSAPVTNGEDALAEGTDDVSDGSTTDTNIGIAEGDATEEKAKKDKKSEKAEKTEMIENKGEEKVDKKEKKKGEKSEKGEKGEKEEDGDDINTKAETSATKDPSPEPSSAPVSDPPTASPVSDPPTAAPVTPEPSSAPVSDPPTASPVSDPPTAAPTPFPSTSPTSNPTSLPTPLPIVWEESSPGHLVTNNNRDKATDGIMLAVTAKASTITITSIDILLDSIDTNVPVEVMITQGSYFGYELYSQIWDTVGSYTIPQGNGHSRVTTIQGLDPITIASGKTIGLYILFPEGHEMLIGSAGEVTGDGDIRIYSGSSVPAKFMSVERGVGWSGAIKYDV